MSRIRVYLLTCRRPLLLRRALASLRAQTFTDWTCELHNDAPEDDGPGRLVAEVADPRIELHQHATNWGPVATFNHAFAGGDEPLLSILEDDNWWEPGFLAAAVAALEAAPDVAVVWANMRIWREEADGAWTDTGRTIWSAPQPAGPPRTFRWPQPIQAFDGLHSNGAMVVRAAASCTGLVPSDLPFAVIEPARERLVAGGWRLLPEPLANFAVTRSTARGHDRAGWMRAQLLVAGSYLAAVPTTTRDLADLWDHLRRQSPPATALLFHLALAGIRPAALLRHARAAEWARFLAGAVRHPLTLVRSLRFRRVHPAAWAGLRAGARARTAEATGVAPAGPPCWNKQLNDHG